MGKNISRCEFAAEDLDSEPEAAKIVGPEWLARRDAARSALQDVGWYPTALGLESMQKEPEYRECCKAYIVGAIDDLDDADLFAIDILVRTLACRGG